MSENKHEATEQSNLRKIGKISGIHGLKGELFVYVFSKDISWIDGLKEVILEDAKGQRHTFKVEAYRPFKEGFLVFVEGIKDRTEAEKYRAHLVYVNADLFVTSEDDESFYLAEIEGFKVFDKDVLLGIIEGFSSNTVQDLLVVAMASGTVEIPLVEDFLINIDFEAHEVHMSLPEGLVESQQEPKK